MRLFWQLYLSVAVLVIVTVIVTDRLAVGNYSASLAALSALLLAVLPCYWVTRRFAAPLIAMTQVARNIAGGDTRQRVVVRSSDEVGRLCHAFNAMADQLEDRMEIISGERSKLLTVLAGMIEGVLAVDLNERVIHINAAAAKILNTGQDVVGRPIWEVTRLREVVAALTATLRTGQEVSAELRVLGPPRERSVELVSSVLRVGGAKPVGALAVLHDVSELRQLENMRRDFVANVSHELKTPIAAVRAMAETILDDPQMSTETRERFTRKICEQALRLSALVSDLLTLARMESGEAALDLQPLDLRSPVVESLNALTGTAEARGITLTREISDTPIRVRGDAEALRQVVTNLLDNALKYTPEGGQVWLQLRADGAHVQIAVRDTGIGIEPKHQDRVFERFYRVDKARSRELGGTGLGLAIVKHVSLLHGGDVSLESEVGRGSTFTVRLPNASS
ncbi:MAG: ATP-binding protein [Planctomycetota bacterium]